MKKILLVFGTRPEAIKMAPLVKTLLQHLDDFETKVCVTAQHREMLDQVLHFFDITPDYDLNLMTPNQTLYSLTADVINGMKPVLESFMPDYVLVHGDTTTSTAAALAAFYAGVKVGHVEAGLRTYNKRSPFPEEMNRQITARLADIHFAPTNRSKQNLLNESVPLERIVVTGNTVIDALQASVCKVNSENYTNKEIEYIKQKIDPKKFLVLVTGHRRENFGKGFENICNALRDLVELRPNIQILFPVHLNPNVQRPVKEILEGVRNIHLIPPLSYPSFVWAMDKCKVIVSDSGGVQEEAPSLGKPVLVMRDVTERPEAVDAGTVILVGTEREKILEEALGLYDNPTRYSTMSRLENPYGDGKACQRIIEFLIND